ncbi:hypothetical protein BAU15_06060 [Enterococcus sp. JM4C]|uniref:hypothetical protein n=1 Tax=Candidatus Enterococcus huntleyi TaxID=1857217 RepID=UPI00137948A0|nr:hypothetical protein [Enterococcus sp. JM4C]KAF1297112.1 hypothetical protein BAU15_06060 [Enterococcus sp. JM4C]
MNSPDNKTPKYDWKTEKDSSKKLTWDDIKAMDEAFEHIQIGRPEEIELEPLKYDLRKIQDYEYSTRNRFIDLPDDQKKKFEKQKISFHA